MKSIKYRRDLWQLFARPGAAAEIGVAEGNNSRDMLEWKLEDGRPAVTTLYMVDRWKENPEQFGDAAMPQDWHDKNFRQVQHKIKPHGTRAIILRGDSVEMADQVPDRSLVLVYIDADHTEPGCFRDLRAWVPKVKKGGIVGLHDFLNEAYGVRKAVEAFCANNFKIHIIEEDKPEDAGAWFRVC
jgi:hypothetical protein